MDLKKELLQELSKAQIHRIIDYIGNDSERFKTFFEIFAGNDYRLTQRSAWILSYSIEKYPQLIDPYWPQIMELVTKKDKHVAVQRNIIRIWQFIYIPEDYEAQVYDICFKNLVDTSTTIATKAFSITVLERICLKYKELSKEICVILHNRLPFETAAFKIRAKKFLKIHQ